MIYVEFCQIHTLTMSQISLQAALRGSLSLYRFVNIMLYITAPETKIIIESAMLKYLFLNVGNIPCKSTAKRRLLSVINAFLLYIIITKVSYYNYSLIASPRIIKDQSVCYFDRLSTSQCQIETAKFQNLIITPDPVF